MKVLIGFRLFCFWAGTKGMDGFTPVVLSRGSVGDSHI